MCQGMVFLQGLDCSGKECVSELATISKVGALNEQLQV